MTMVSDVESSKNTKGKNNCSFTFARRHTIKLTGEAPGLYWRPGFYYKFYGNSTLTFVRESVHANDVIKHTN